MTPSRFGQIGRLARRYGSITCRVRPKLIELLAKLADDVGVLFREVARLADVCLQVVELGHLIATHRRVVGNQVLGPKVLPLASANAVGGVLGNRRRVEVGVSGTRDITAQQQLGLIDAVDCPVGRNSEPRERRECR